MASWSEGGYLFLALELRHQGLLVVCRNPAFVLLVNMADYVERFIVLVGTVESEDRRWPDIVGGRWKVDNKTTRKQVIPIFVGGGGVVDKDVGEGCRRICDICLSRECREKATDWPFIRFGSYSGSGVSSSSKSCISGVDRSLVGFVVDHQERASFGVAARRKNSRTQVLRLSRMLAFFFTTSITGPLLDADPKIVRNL